MLDRTQRFWLGFLGLLTLFVVIGMLVLHSCSQPVKYVTVTETDTVTTVIYDTIRANTIGLELVAQARWNYNYDDNAQYGVDFFCAIRNLTGHIIYDPEVTAYYYSDMTWDTLVVDVTGPFYQDLVTMDTVSEKMLPEARAYTRLWVYPEPQLLYWSFVVSWSNEMGDIFHAYIRPEEMLGYEASD